MRRYAFRHPGEIRYVILGVIFGVILFSLAIFLLLFIPDLEGVDPLLLNGLALVLLSPIIGMVYRRFRQASFREKFLRISPEQFPDIYQYLKEASDYFKLPEPPAAYLVSSPSVNPCSEDYGARPAVWIGTDFYAGCRENNTPEALRFIVAHQVAHIAASHGTTAWYVLCGPIINIPLLKGFLTRTMEYSADAGAASFCPEGAARAFQLCAVGKDNFVYASAITQMQEAKAPKGLLGHIAHLISDQPSATRRLTAIVKKKLIANPLTAAEADAAPPAR